MHISLGARMVAFADWEMPLLYEGIIAEHLYTRRHASIFDTCHMGIFELKGLKAERDLERLLTQAISSLEPGASSYGYLLSEDGGVLDDVICFRRSSNCFWLVVNAGTRSTDAKWIQSHLSTETSFKDYSTYMAKLDIQGPASKEEMEKALGESLPVLDYFHFTDITLRGISCTLSRTGYTGEYGYELFMPAKDVGLFWSLFLAKSQIKPAGLGARDSLRIEMGYPLYGHELKTSRTPVGISRKRFIDFTKKFIGKETVQQEMEAGPAEVMAGLRLQGRMAARTKDPVATKSEIVGEVTSGMFSPSLGSAIALCYVNKEFNETGQELMIHARKNLLPASVVKLPFYKKGTVRKLNKDVCGP